MAGQIKQWVLSWNICLEPWSFLNFIHLENLSLLHRCEEDSSPEGPKAIVEGIIEEEEEEEEDEDENGGHSINKRKKADDTEVGSE